MNLKQTQAANFNSYDPRVGQNNGWDPMLATKFNNADGGYSASTIFGARPGQKMQLNLTLNNATGGLLTFEMFNFLQSVTRVQNPNYASGAYLYIPLTSFEGIEAMIAGTDQCVGFNKNGDLEIHAATAAVKGTISCGESPYASLFAATSSIPFNIQYIRETVTTDPQIDKPLIYFQKSFSGGQVQNNVSPRVYFNPNQFQGKIIDIGVQFAIGQDTGFSIVLLAAEVVKLSLFVDAWGTQALVAN